MGCFSHLPPVKLNSASNTDNSWHPPVTPEIQMSSVPVYPDRVSVHCAPVSTKALYFCGSDVPGHQIHRVQYNQSSLSSLWPKVGSLYSFSWSEYSLSDPCGGRPEVPTPGSRKVILILLCLGHRRQLSCVSTATTLTAFLGGSFLTAVFLLSLHVRASSLMVGSPSHLLISSPWSRRKNESAPHGMHLGLFFSSDRARRGPISWGIPDTRDSVP